MNNVNNDFRIARYLNFDYDIVPLFFGFVSLCGQTYHNEVK